MQALSADAAAEVRVELDVVGIGDGCMGAVGGVLASILGRARVKAWVTGLVRSMVVVCRYLPCILDTRWLVRLVKMRSRWMVSASHGDGR